MAETHEGTLSTSQMDNFYLALAGGTAKPTGVMNYVQHLFIAHQCPEGASVLDMCCGRGLQIPLLKRYAPTVGCYVGVDISQTNLDEAQAVIRYGDGQCPLFPYEFIRGDVRFLTSFLRRQFDVIVYTSALEHMGRDAGIASLEQGARALTEQGTFYLSTPRTEGPLPRQLQHRVHIYEWGREELEQVLAALHLTIIASYGLLPPTNDVLIPVIASRFGEGAAAWVQDMQRFVPSAFLAPVMASSFPEVATELLFVCRKSQ